MKTAVVLLLSLAAASFAADPKPNPVKEPDTRLKTEKSDVVKRLGAVTWDLDTHKLVWVVQKGSMVDGQFVTESEQKYEISPDKALMAVEDEARGFDGDEAISLHKLLDVLSLYCAESVVWWDEGQGTPTENQPANRPAKPKADPDGKPVKVGQPEPNRTPKTYKVPDDHIVALVK
jgi:hypothetical protein